MGFFTVSEVPDILNKERMLEALGRNNIAIVYINPQNTFIWVEESKEGLVSSLEQSIPGFKAEKLIPSLEIKGKKLKALSFYRLEEEEPDDTFHDLFSGKVNGGFLILAFINAKEKEIELAKRYAESLLSSKDMRETKPTSPGVRGLLGPSSVHRDIYKDTEELLISKTILDSINQALLKNNLLYKMLLIYDSEAADIESYLKDKVAILAEEKIVADDFASLLSKASKIKAFPSGAKYCTQFLHLFGARVLRTIKSSSPTHVSSGISIGKIMEDGVSESQTDACLELSSLNLGSLITGLPGSGKTMEAMHISDRVINSGQCPSFIIAPTEEWNSFAISHGMNLIRLFSDSLRINFFRCPPTAKKEKFCQDLSVILSSASGAGPYKRPMEKCMLNAFVRIYASTPNPDPVDVYCEIEESIIKLHGKRTNTGIKYTKHGENIKAALENLKIILNDPKYSTNNGIKFEELLAGGAVFDMSATSIATRSFLYALILNQLYAITSSFDTTGDDKLRMFICVEEAQIIFKEEDSPAVEDLKQRIQDFRKRGVGIMLLAHNISDIDLGIRRLCQTRLYMKQAPDSAYLAAKELIFPDMETEKIIEKLKLLDSRVGALSLVTRKGKEKVQEESILIKTEAFEQTAINIPTTATMASESRTPAKLKVTLGDNFDDSTFSLQLKFLNEALYEIKPIRATNQLNLIENRRYKLCLLNDKGKIIAETEILGKPQMQVFVDKNKLLEMSDLP